MTKVFSSTLLAGLAAAILLLPGALHAQTTKLRVSTNQNIDAAAFEAARAQGFFTQEGLDIDATPVIGGAAGLPALASGQVQVSSSNLISTVLGVKNGLPFKIVAAGDATFDAPPDLAGIIGKKGHAIKSGKDLEGKRLAVNARNGITWLFARAWVEATGGDPTKVTFTEIPHPQMVDAILQGRVAGGMIVEPFLTNGLHSGQMEVIGWPYATVQKRIPISQWVSTQAFIDQHPDVLARFVRAYNKGTDWINQHNGDDQWVALISRYTKIAPDVVKRSAVPAFVTVVDPKNVATTIELMRHHGLLSASDKIDPMRLLHTSVLTRP
jgi:NitT/TauT family transport system substrate-binding protein